MVEGTQAEPVAAAPFQRHVFADYLQDVGPLHYFVDDVLGDASGHSDTKKRRLFVKSMPEKAGSKR